MPPKPNPLTAGSAESIASASIKPAKADTAPLNAQQKTALQEALEDLAELDEYADEMKLKQPAPIAKEAARVFLQNIIRKAPRRYAISMWDEGEVVVYTQGAKGFRVSVYFNAEGGASCYVTRPGSRPSEDRHYSSAEEVVNDWVLTALRNLGE